MKIKIVALLILSCVMALSLLLASCVREGEEEEVIIPTEEEEEIVASTINISPASGYVGTKVTVSGTGFRANKPIDIFFNNEAINSTSADAYGKVSASFNVPSLGAGTYIVKVRDGINTAQANFTISTSASISPKTSASSPGYVGTEVTMSGIGFITGTPVTVRYDGTQVATATVDANGGFSAKFKAPASIGGQHTVVATIDTATETFTFFMDSTAPQWPPPLKPEMGIEAEAETYFDWGDVTDPSGVTYTLQIATSEDFSEGLLEMIGIQQSEYTLTSEEKLDRRSEENPYYWRVRAVDGASNVSEWTLPGTFYVGGGFSWTAPEVGQKLILSDQFSISPIDHEAFTDTWSPSYLPYNEFGLYIDRFYLKQEEVVTLVMRSNQMVSVDCAETGCDFDFIECLSAIIYYDLLADLKNPDCIYSECQEHYRIDNGWEVRVAFTAETTGLYYIAILNESGEPAWCEFELFVKSG